MFLCEISPLPGRAFVSAPLRVGAVARPAEGACPKIFFRRLRLRDADIAASQDVDILVDQHHVFQEKACPRIDIHII